MTWIGELRNKDDIHSLPHSFTFLFAVVVMTKTSISLPFSKNSITQFRRNLEAAPSRYMKAIKPHLPFFSFFVLSARHGWPVSRLPPFAFSASQPCVDYTIGEKELPQNRICHDMGQGGAMQSRFGGFRVSYPRGNV